MQREYIMKHYWNLGVVNASASSTSIWQWPSTSRNDHLEETGALIKCTECPRPFTANHRLGQHIRHDHQTLCNQKRRKKQHQSLAHYVRDQLSNLKMSFLWLKLYGQKKMAVRLQEFLYHKT